MPILFDPIWKGSRCKKFKEGEPIVVQQMNEVNMLRIPKKWKEVILGNVYLEISQYAQEDKVINSKDRLRSAYCRVNRRMYKTYGIERIAKELNIKPYKELEELKAGKISDYDVSLKINILKDVYKLRRKGYSFNAIARFLGFKTSSRLTFWTKFYDFNLPEEVVFDEIEYVERFIRRWNIRSNNRGFLFEKVTNVPYVKGLSTDVLGKFADFILDVLRAKKEKENVYRKYLMDYGIYLSETTLSRLVKNFSDKSREEIIEMLREGGIYND